MVLAGMPGLAPGSARKPGAMWTYVKGRKEALNADRPGNEWLCHLGELYAFAKLDDTM